MLQDVHCVNMRRARQKIGGSFPLAMTRTRTPWLNVFCIGYYTAQHGGTAFIITNGSMSLRCVVRVATVCVGEMMEPYLSVSWNPFITRIREERREKPVDVWTFGTGIKIFEKRGMYFCIRVASI